MGKEVSWRRRKWRALGVPGILVILALWAWASGRALADVCVPGDTQHYETFSEGDFSHLDSTITVDDDGHVVLNTGAGAIDKENIILPSQQEVRVTFLYEGAGYTRNHFGYFLRSVAEENGYITSGELNRTAFIEAIDFSDGSYDNSTFHYIFSCINDNNNNGILEKRNDSACLKSFGSSGDFASTEAALGQVDDGTGLPFVVDGDGELTARDMTKSLGLIGEGEEIIFFLVPNGSFSSVFLNKTSWNGDKYTGGCKEEFSDCSPLKVYKLGQAITSEGSCVLESGWLSGSAFNRLSQDLGITLDEDDTYSMEICKDQPFSHLVVGAPREDPTQWVLGWEDLWGGGDTDHNDVVFKVQRKTGGRAVSTVTSGEIASDNDTYITSVDFEVTDYTINCVSSTAELSWTSGQDTLVSGTFESDLQGGCPACDNATDNATLCSAASYEGSVTEGNFQLTGTIDDDFTQVDLAGAVTITDGVLTLEDCGILDNGTCHAMDPLVYDPLPVAVVVQASGISVDSDTGTYNASFSVTGGMDIHDNATLPVTGGTCPFHWTGALLRSCWARRGKRSGGTCPFHWTGALQDQVTLSGRLNGDWKTRTNEASYYLSVDNGSTWFPITAWDQVVDHDNGTQTRRVHVDMLSLGLIGRALKWKAVLESKDDQCPAAAIHEVKLSYNAAGNGEYSRSDPIVLGNVLYSATVETPAAHWSDLTRLRGHLRAYKIYDPSDPNTPLYQELWDAGESLDNRTLADDPRKIFMALPDPPLAEETLATGDGQTREFSGFFQHGRILPGSLTIQADYESGTMELMDSGVSQLQGDGGDNSTVNRYTGEYHIDFLNPPCGECPIEASYRYYPDNSTITEFGEETVSAAMLGLDNEYVQGQGYTWDLNEDGAYDDQDRVYLIRRVLGFDNGTEELSWPLAPLDHSTPAAIGPPGVPLWYYGTGVSQEERDAFDHWMAQWAQRPTVVYVGGMDGMLHAFDGGAYRHGDDPSTAIQENRGYFQGGNYGTGRELWTFIPNNVLPRLKYLLKRNHPQVDLPSVDASPAVEDISIYSDGQYQFLTVLLSAEGDGGDTIFGLDVTDPEDPKFLWEFADPSLYRSRSSPSIGKIGRLNSRGHPVWAAFFVSGRTQADDFPLLFVVNAATGELLGKIELKASDEGNRGAVLSGSAAIVDSDGNGFIDRAYVSDNMGHVYRVDLPDDPDAVLHLENARVTVLVKVPTSVYATPVVYLNNTYNPDGTIHEYHTQVMFGTGDNPYFQEDPNTSTNYKFYVFDDTCHAQWISDNATLYDNAGIVCGNPIATESDAQWQYELPAGHRIWAEAVAAAGMVYFGTATSETEDPCSPSDTPDNSTGNVYALDLGELPQQPDVVAEDVGRVTALVVEDEHLYLKTTDDTGGTRVQVVGDGEYNNEVIVGQGYNVNKVRGSWRQILNR